MKKMMRLFDAALSLFPSTPPKRENIHLLVTPEAPNMAKNTAPKVMTRGSKRKTRSREAVSKTVSVESEQDSSSRGQASVYGADVLNGEENIEINNNVHSESESSDDEDEDLNGAQLAFQAEKTSDVSDLSCASKTQLIRMLEETRRTLLDLQEEGYVPKKKKMKMMPSTVDEKKIDMEVTNILRYEIVRWMKFQTPGWNGWSDKPGTVCKIICDKVVNWPMNVTEDYKRRMWCRLFEPRLNRKLSVIKSKISQRMKEIFMSEYIICRRHLMPALI